MGQGGASGSEKEAEKTGLQLDAGFKPFTVEDDLDCAIVKKDKNLELWLLQVPIDFPLDEQTVWHAAQPGSRRLNAICQIEDAGYRLIEEEQEVEAAPVYAVGSLDSQPVQVTRRVVIYRQSEAVTKVFGMEEVDPLDDVVANDDDVGGGAVAVKGQTPLMAAAAEEKKEKTKKKKKERKEEEDEEDEPPQKKKKSKKKK